MTVSVTMLVHGDIYPGGFLYGETVKMRPHLPSDNHLCHFKLHKWVRF